MSEPRPHPLLPPLSPSPHPLPLPPSPILYGDCGSAQTHHVCSRTLAKAEWRPLEPSILGRASREEGPRMGAGATSLAPSATRMSGGPGRHADREHRGPASRVALGCGAPPAAPGSRLAPTSSGTRERSSTSFPSSSSGNSGPAPNRRPSPRTPRARDGDEHGLPRGHASTTMLPYTRHLHFLSTRGWQSG